LLSDACFARQTTFLERRIHTTSPCKLLPLSTSYNFSETFAEIFLYILQQTMLSETTWKVIGIMRREEPTPYPSQEGNLRIGNAQIFPSWEGEGWVNTPD